MNYFSEKINFFYILFLFICIIFTKTHLIWFHRIAITMIPNLL